MNLNGLKILQGLIDRVEQWAGPYRRGDFCCLREVDPLQTLRDILLFDRKDHELLNPYLNPHGIKEMATSQAFRIAYAIRRTFRRRRPAV